MKQAQRKSFDWYKMQQRFSIRKYHFGAASVLLGTALVLGTAVNTQAVQAEEHNPEATNSVSVDKIAETTKPAEVSTAKKETTYAAPTVVNPVEVTPAKSEAVKATVEKVEEPKVEKEEVSHQSAVDKSKLLTALSRAKKLEAKLYTEASAANLKASIQAGQSLLGKADATEAELSAAESSIQSAVIGLELRSNSDKGTVSETSVAKKADAAEAKEEAKPAATTTDRSVLDSAVLPTSRAAIVEASSAPKTTNEILKPGLSLSDARQNPAIRKEDLEKGHSGFRASSNPANPIVSGSGNTISFTDISQAGRSYSFRGYGNARGGHSIHYDVTTVRQGNRLNFTIQYSGPGEFVNNNFILDKGDGFGNPSNATITTPRLREQSKPISQGANFVSHSGYTMTSATETSMQQTIRFSLPINNPNGDLSVRLKPVTFNVDQGGGGAATSNDPYSNSNYYYRANPLYLDANPNGGSSNKVVTEDIDFQTVYLPTSKLPEGQTRLVREGEKGQRQITYKVHRFGNETILGLPISNSVTKEAKPRILQIGVAKELIDTVKPRVDQNKVGDTNNLTFYLDNDGNGVYTEGVDELVQKIAIKDGAKGEKGDQGERGLTGAKGEKGDRGERGLTGAKGEKGDRGERGLTGAKGEKGDRGERGLTGAKGEKGDRGERGLTGAKGEKGDQGQAGRDGVTPTVTVKDNKDDGTHTITINDGRGNVTNTIVRDGFDGASPLVATQRNEADKTTTVIFYYDQNDNNEFDAGDTKLKEVVIADGAKGEKGDKGATPKVTTARGADGRSTDITFTVPGEEPVVANIKDGKDGRTPTIDLNALAEAAVRLNNQRSGRVRRALSDAPSTAPAPQPVEGTRITAYYDNNGNGKYDPGVDELIGTSDILNGTNGRNGADGASGTDGRNGAELLSGPKAPTANDGKDGDTYIDATTGDVYKKEGRNWNQIGNIRGPQGLPGPKGDKGENGRDGFTPEVTVTDNHDGTHTITITQPEGRPALTTIVKNGENGQTPKVKAVRDEAKKQTTLTFYLDKDGDGNYTEGTDTLVQTSIVKDGQDGAAGQAGRDGKEVLNGKVDPTPRDGKDGDSFVNTATGDVFVKKNNTWEQAGNIKGPKGDKGENGRDGFTPEVTVTDNHDGTHTITITQPEGRPAVTTTIKNGVDGQTPKVKAERDEAKKQTTLTFYIDKDGDGNYTEGTDTLVQTSIVKDGQDGAAGQAGRDGKEVLNGKLDPTPRDGKDGDSFVNTATGDVFVKKNNTWEQAGNIKGPKGDKGENGRDGFTPEVTVTDNHDGSHTITVTQPEGRPALTTIVKNGVDGQTPKVKAERDEAKKQTTLTFYIDKDGDGNYTEGTDTLVQTSIVKDGQDGAAGQAGRDGKEVLNGKVDPTPRDGKDGDSFVNTATGDVFVKKNNTWEPAGNIKGPKGDKGENGRDGFTPEVTVTDNHDGTHTITITQPEGRPALTTTVKNGENGQTPKVKAERDEAKKQTTLTFYIDKDGDGNYTEGTDTLVQTSIVKDGQDGATGQAGRDGKEVLNGKVDPTPRDGKDGDSFVNTVTGDVFVKKNNAWEQAGNIKGPKGDKGENGRDGFTPEVTVTDNHDGTHTITITQPEGRPALTTIVKNGENGQTPKVKAVRDEAKKQTTLTFYIDKDGDGNYTEGTDTLVQTSIVKDGQDGAAGQAGRDGKEVLNGKVDPTPIDGKDGDSFVNTATGDVFVKKNNTWEQAGNIKGPKGDKGENGRDGFTPEVTVTDNHDGTHTITITQPEGRPALTTIVKNGENGQTPKVKAVRDEAKKQTTLTFYIDKDGDGNYTEGTDTLVQTSIVKDGQDGAAGRDGKEVLNGKVDPQPRDGKDGDSFVNTITGDVFVKKNNTWEQAGNIKGPKGDKGENGEVGPQGPKGEDGKTPEVTVTPGKDGHSSDITFTVTGKTPVTVNVKNGENGLNGKTPKVDLLRVEGQNGNPSHTIVTFYTDENGDGKYTVGTDELLGSEMIKDGAKGADGRDGKSLLTVKEGKETKVYQEDPANPGQPLTPDRPLAVIRDGVDGQTPKVKAERDEANKQTTLTFYIDKDGDGNYTAGKDELVQTTVVKDGQDGAAGPKGADGASGRDGKEVLNGKVDPTPRDGKDGDSFVNTATGDVFVKKNNAWEQAGNIKGPKGDKGAEGAQGPQGLKGDKGEQGLQGRDGRDGAQGPAGRDGKDVLNGKVDPTTEGKDGDKYVNTETGDVFVKNNGTWEQAGNIKGPKGDKGERGEDGKTPEVTVTPGKDGHSTDITFTVPGKDPVTVNVKNGENGLNGQTPKVDLLRVEGKNGNPSHTIVTFYTDENNDGKYTPGTDELLGSEMIKDGAKGADGRDGKSLLTVKEGKETKVYQEDPANPGQPLTPDRPLAVIRDGVDGKSPTVTAARKEEVDHKGVEITVDNHDGSQPTTVFVHDGAKGETGANGQNGQTPTVTTQRGADGHSTVVTITTPGKEPVTFTVRDGLDGHNGNNGRTPKIDLQPYINGEDSFRRARRSVGNNPDEVSGHPNSRATSSDNADGTHVTVYFDNNGNNHYDPGVDELISERDVLNGVNGENGASGRDGRNGSELLSGNIAPTPKDGKNGDTYIDSLTGDVYKKQNGAWNKTGNIRGPQGAKGDTPEVTAKPGADGHSTDITITTPGKDPVTVNVKNGKDGKSLIAKKEGNETKIFAEDPANPGQPLDATKPLATVLDGLKGEKGDNGADGKSPVVNVTDNGDGTHSITVRNPDGSESTTKVKDGKDGKTATITTTENPDGSHTITVTNPDGSSKETVVKNGKDGKTPKVEVTDNNDGTHTVKVTDGDGNVTNAIIKDGKDGKAATATTTENPDGSHTVTITNPDGTKNEFVVKNGRDGVDGRTPSASVRDNGDGSHTIVITNPEGVTTETTVRDGKSPKVTITDEQNGTHKISVLNGDGTTTETIVKDGKSPVATVTDNHDGTYTIRVENGNGTVSETTVRDGKSPTAKVVDNGDGTHTITVVNSDGTTTTTTVRDGKAPKLEVIDNNNGSHIIKVTGTDGKETTTTIFDGKSPKANIVDNGDGTHTLTIVDSDGREYKSIIKDGKDGKDGVSPTVTVKNNNDGTHVVTIINPDGSKTEMVIKDGKDGKSPKVSVEDNGNGSHTITIINSDGTVTKTVIKDGKDGRDGRDGKDGKDGKCGCQDKPVTPSNDKPVPPTRNVPQGPTFAIPEPPVHELPEFNGGVPGMPEVTEVPELDIPTVPAQPIPNVPTLEVPVQPVPAVPEQPVVPTPAQPATPVNDNPVVPTTVKENHGDKLPETGSQSDYISVLLGSGILLSLYVGRRKED